MHACQKSTVALGLQAAGDGLAAGTSSFGMSGVNAHLLLQRAAGAVPLVQATQVHIQAIVGG